jgi:hypothetical protein
MCWNKDISLNTFIFSSFVLLLIMYNNKYTPYKIPDLNNVWVYVFFISFILMQLLEYFIWKNINEPLYNKLFTTLATLLLLLQPVASTMLITNKVVRYNLLTLYLILSIPFAIYRFMTRKIYSSVSPLGHLHWNLLLDKKSKLDKLIMTLWFTFFLFPLFYQGYTYGFLFGFLTLLFIMYSYSKDGTVGSMWCWIINSIMVFYASYLLLYLPFYK